jgi:hypothetical protein
MRYSVEVNGKQTAVIETNGNETVVIRQLKDDVKQNETSYIDKWFKYIGNKTTGFTPNKWYKCVADPIEPFAFIDDRGDTNGVCPKNHLVFDLNNPVDRDPDEEMGVPFDYARYISGDFEKIKTKDGRSIEHLTEFNNVRGLLFGLVEGESFITCWYASDGLMNGIKGSLKDLWMIIKPNKP